MLTSRYEEPFSLNDGSSNGTGLNFLTQTECFFAPSLCGLHCMRIALHRFFAINVVTDPSCAEAL